jgi:hypothetical protein
VALAGVDVDLVVGVFAVTVDDVFAVESVVVFKRFVRSKVVGVDSERLPVALAAFLPGRNVHFVDFDRANKIDGRRIERSMRRCIVLCVSSISHCS